MDDRIKHHVDGIDKGDILLFALSTCGWCFKTKALLKQFGVRFSYIDVDTLDWDDAEVVSKEIKKYTSRVSYPTLIFNKKESIVGYDPDRLTELLGN